MSMVNKLQITLCVLQEPGRVLEQVIELPEGTTVLAALAHSAPWLTETPETLLEQGMVGVWGRKTHAQRVLEPQDRLEVYRPLVVDPKLARKQRFGQQGARSAGLFAKRRPGAKPGY